MKNPRSEALSRAAGTAAFVGGVLGILLAPIMVIVKYMTGWSVISEPSWIDVVTPALGALLAFATPVGLWVVYGSLYTTALLLMFAGLVALAIQTRHRTGRVQPWGLWVVLFGLCLVIPGDAVHTATWHQHGLTTPTPGTSPLANTAYAIHMMGMNFVMVGCVMTGISALRSRLFTRWLAWLFILVFPSAVLMSLTLLPTTPSGGLWLFSVMMVALGYSLRSGRPSHLAAV